MTEIFTPWDPLNYLKTDDDFRLYLEACAEGDSGDGTLIRNSLRDIARAAEALPWLNDSVMEAAEFAAIAIARFEASERGTVEFERFFEG